MKKLNLILTTVILGLLLLSVLTLFIMNNTPQEGDVIATIAIDGKTYKEINLTKVQIEETFSIDNNRGGKNTIAIRPGEVSIVHANCHDQICVERGYISNSVLPIVCLPNGVVITLETINSSDSSEFDIISQ